MVKISKDNLEIVRCVMENGKISATDIQEATGIAAAKATKLFKRCAGLGFLECSSEIRFARGRPKLYYSLTPKGKEFFERMLSDSTVT